MSTSLLRENRKLPLRLRMWNQRYLYLLVIIPLVWLIVFCYVPMSGLVLAFMIALNIYRDRSFCLANARLLAWIAVLAAADTVYFFVGNIILALNSMHHGGFFMICMLVCFAGVAVTVTASALSHYARKAAELKEQADLTI